MNVVMPKPLRESRDTVTLRRADWEALIDLIEDAEDIASVSARRAREAAIGRDAVRRDYLTGDELRRLLGWESPLKVWREKRGQSQRDLARAAGVSPSYLAEIETGRKPGSAEALLNLARVLEVPMERLVGSDPLQLTFQRLRQLAETGTAEADTVAEGKQIVRALKTQGMQRDDLAELADRLRTLAIEWRDAGRTHEAAALQAIVRQCCRNGRSAR